MPDLSVDAEELRAQVRIKYREVAVAPGATYHFHTGRDLASRLGYDAEAVAANCYSAVMIMADAIKRAGGTDPKKIREALAATKDFPMLTGKLGYFSATGEMYMPLEVTVVKGNNFAGVAVIDDTSILAPAK